MARDRLAALRVCPPPFVARCPLTDTTRRPSASSREGVPLTMSRWVTSAPQTTRRRRSAFRTAAEHPATASTPCPRSTQRCAAVSPSALAGISQSSSAMLWQITSIQDSISTYETNINRIAELHSRTLNSTDEAANHQNAAILDDLINQTRDLGNTIKQRIQALESKPLQPGQDARIRKNRVRPLPHHRGAHPLPRAGSSPCFRFARASSEPSSHLPHTARLRAFQVRRGAAALPAGRARLPAAVQAAGRAAVPHRCVHSSVPAVHC